VDVNELDHAVIVQISGVAVAVAYLNKR